MWPVPVQLLNNLEYVTPQKTSLSNSHFFIFKYKYFGPAFGSWWQMTLFNTIFDPLIELKSVILRKIFPPGPAVPRHPYPVQLSNYLGAVPGTGRKTLRYLKEKTHDPNLFSDLLKNEIFY